MHSAPSQSGLFFLNLAKCVNNTPVHIQAAPGTKPSIPCLHVGGYYVTPDLLNFVWKMFIGTNVAPIDIGRTITFLWHGALERQGVRGNPATFQRRLERELALHSSIL
eukprot:EG_transcript_65297